jgi:hypothetical protein
MDPCSIRQEVLSNLHSNIRYILKRFQVPGEGDERQVLLVSVILSDWNAVVQVEQVPSASVRHDYYVLQVSLTQQDIQVHNVVVYVLIVVQTIFAQDVVEEGLFLLELSNDLLCIALNIRAEKD